MATNAGLAFGALGPLQMRVAGTEVPLGTPKQRAVLAMLVINRNRPVGIESLLGVGAVPSVRCAGEPALLRVESAQTHR